VDNSNNGKIGVVNLQETRLEIYYSSHRFITTPTTKQPTAIERISSWQSTPIKGIFYGEIHKINFHFSISSHSNRIIEDHRHHRARDDHIAKIMVYFFTVTLLHGLAE
jgi:uncharacterized phage-associated protein